TGAAETATGAAAAGAPPAVAAVAPRRRMPLRFLRHPGFAAAASILFVGVSAAWLLTTNRRAALHPEMAMAPPYAASAPAPAAPRSASNPVTSTVAGAAEPERL